MKYLRFVVRIPFYLLALALVLVLSPLWVPIFLFAWAFDIPPEEMTL